MNSKENISSFDLSLLRKYVTKTLSFQEEKQFNVFLKDHPEYKELLDTLTLVDLEKIERVNASSLSAVKNKVNRVKRKAALMVAAAVVVLITLSIVFDLKEVDKGKEWAQSDDAQNEQNEQNDLLALDTSVVTPESYQKEIIKDTFYYVNTDEATPEVAIEYIEEKEGMKEWKETPDPVQPLTHADSLPQSVTMLAEDHEVKPSEENEKSFAFTASLDYRQSLAVEDNVAGAYKVGQTKSFAGPIGGYEYDPNGMPYFGDKEGALYDYIEQQLREDKLLTKIQKSMEAKVSFEVDNKGHVENVNVVKCNHKQLCLKLTEIFEQMPDWYPADFKGKKGSVHYVIQVSYK